MLPLLLVVVVVVVVVIVVVVVVVAVVVFVDEEEQVFIASAKGRYGPLLSMTTRLFGQSSFVKNRF